MTNIPAAVSSRLPLYYEYIVHMEEQGSRWVSSNMIASALDLTPSTIRQDIKYLDKIYSSSFGYSTQSFRQVLEDALGISASNNMALVGAGSLGRALAHYKGFPAKGFTIKAIFDKRDDLIDTDINGVKVWQLGRLNEVVKRERISIGIITTPADAAQQVANMMVDAKIMGIWNFAPINLRVPPNVMVENVNVMPSLFSLAFKMKVIGNANKK